MQTEGTPRRKYALARIRAGDYLLPGNDGRTIWRISRYMDGPSMGLDWPRDRWVWGVWKWTGSVDPNACVDPEDWSRWEQWSSVHLTRAEAVDYALRDIRAGSLRAAS